MLYLPFSDLPLKKCPILVKVPSVCGWPSGSAQLTEVSRALSETPSRHTCLLLRRCCVELFLADPPCSLAPHLTFGDLSKISGLQKGPAERGHVKKTSKIVKKCQKVFRHFSTFFAQGKKRQKSSKSVKKFFDTFRQFSRGTFFPAPFAIR